MKNPTIAGLAEAGGVGVETVRYYQRKGLLKTPSRGGSAVRRYDNNDIRRLRFIRFAQAAGFTLNHGTYDAVSGTWSLTPADLAGLTISAPKDFSGTLNLTASVTDTETNLSGVEYDTSDNSATVKTIGSTADRTQGIDKK